MSRIWKEPLTEQRAKEINVRTEPECIYYIHLCSFTFVFYSLTMIQEYREYYNTKILPSRRGGSIWVGEPQSPLNRLPLRLRNESKRHRIVKALSKALHEFCR